MIQFLHIQMHKQLLLSFQLRPIQSTPIWSAYFWRMIPGTKPLICPQMMLPLEMSLQFIQFPRYHWHDSPTKHAVKTMPLYQRIFRSSSKDYRKRGNLQHLLSENISTAIQRTGQNWVRPTFSWPPIQLALLPSIGTNLSKSFQAVSIIILGHFCSREVQSRICLPTGTWLLRKINRQTKTIKWLCIGRQWIKRTWSHTLHDSGPWPTGRNRLSTSLLTNIPFRPSATFQKHILQHSKSGQRTF